MPLTFEAFRDEFQAKVEALNMTWQMVGFFSRDGAVYPFGTDTKVISTVFESLASPLIHEIATAAGYVVEGSPQTIYPDFTLTPAEEPDELPPRIAVDIKTTYRRFGPRGAVAPMRFTLGSYTSFLRSPGAAKNILYPYGEYGHHWVIGFLYTRRLGVTAKVHYDPEDALDLECPYEDVEYFTQEKYKIVGLSPASGNTTNMGSFATADIEALRQGRGPFAAYGKEICDAYWANYPRVRNEREYSTVEEFLQWRDARS